MTDLNGDGIPDQTQAPDSTGRPGDGLSRFMNDPGVRRGARIAGRFAVGYLIAGAVFFVIVLVFIIVIATKVFSNT